MLTNQEIVKRQKQRLIYAEHNRRISANDRGEFVRNSPGLQLGNTNSYSQVIQGLLQFTPTEFQELFIPVIPNNTTYIKTTIFAYLDNSNIMIRVYNQENNAFYDAIDSGYHASQLESSINSNIDMYFCQNGFIIAIQIASLQIIKFISTKGNLLKTIEINTTANTIVHSPDAENKISNHFILQQNTTTNNITINRYNFEETVHDTFLITDISGTHETFHTIGNHCAIIYVDTNNIRHLSVLYKTASEIIDIYSGTNIVETVFFDPLNGTSVYKTYILGTLQQLKFFFINTELSTTKTLDLESYELKTNITTFNFPVTRLNSIVFQIDDLARPIVKKLFVVDWGKTNPIVDLFVIDSSGSQITDFPSYSLNLVTPSVRTYTDEIDNWQITKGQITFLVSSNTTSSSSIQCFSDRRDIRIGMYQVDTSGQIYDFPKALEFNHWVFSGNTLSIVTYTLDGIASLTTINSIRTNSVLLADVSGNSISNDLSGLDISGLTQVIFGRTFALKDRFIYLFQNESTLAGHFIVIDKSANYIYRTTFPGITTSSFIEDSESSRLIFENFMFFKLSGADPPQIFIFNGTTISTATDISGDIINPSFKISTFHAIQNDTTRHLAYYIPNVGYTTYTPINTNTPLFIQTISHKNAIILVKIFDTYNVIISIVYNEATNSVTLTEIEFIDSAFDDWTGSEKGIQLTLKNTGDTALRIINVAIPSGIVTNALINIPYTSNDYKFLSNSYSTLIIQE